MKSWTILLSTLCLFSCNQQENKFEKYVDPLIGTDIRIVQGKDKNSTEERGQIMPAVGIPHGMTNWVAQTQATEQKCHPPYYYFQDAIQGFRASHWMNGSCTQDYGSVTIMPLSNKLEIDPVKRASTFDHTQETATPSYYSVDLNDYDIHAELTGLSRADIMQFCFEQDGDHYIVIEPNSDEGVAFVEIDPKEAQKKLNLPRNPRDYTSIAVTTDDSNDEIVYASSMGDGVIQYKNGTPVQSYNEKNAFKETAGGYGSGYCYIDGLAFDKNGNLWMTSSEVNHAVLVLDKAGAWHRLDIEQLRGVYTINDILITSTNDKWIYVPRNTPKLVMIPNSESLDEVSSYEFTTLIDTDGKELTPSNYTCVAEDKDGYIWVGTNRGAVYFTKPRISSAEDKAATRCTRVKYTNEETGNLAYFLDNVVVTTLKVDAGNRKWIGTKGNGVYVLDNDNETIVYQFNTTNSPLLSDNIYDIEINDKTGEVFIGTDKGLNSYQGEASEGKSDYSEIYAYPNPVRPEHMDKVTIVGLMDNSNVKITDLNGNIIYQTKSLGGQAIWNCRNASGSRVATGVYLVLASTEEASESVVTKIIVVK